MGTYKENYDLVKSKTIDYFFKFFQGVVNRINTEKIEPVGGYGSRSFPQNHDLKDAITEIIMDEQDDTIRFKLLGKKILCAYNIYPRAEKETAKIEIYKTVLDYESKDFTKLEHLKGFDIVFGERRDEYPIIFEGIDYNRKEFRVVDRTITEYFDEYLKLLTDKVFTPEKSGA